MRWFWNRSLAVSNTQIHSNLLKCAQIRIFYRSLKASVPQNSAPASWSERRGKRSNPVQRKLLGHGKACEETSESEENLFDSCRTISTAIVRQKINAHVVQRKKKRNKGKVVKMQRNERKWKEIWKMEKSEWKALSHSLDGCRNRYSCCVPCAMYLSDFTFRTFGDEVLFNR